MIFTRAEIDILLLSAWCKDLPVDESEMLPPDTVRLMCTLGLLRQSRCKLSYRTTPTGYTLLQKADYSYKPDKQYLGYGPALLRRIHTAEITCFFWRLGAEVFLQNPGAKNPTLSFLPSFVLRRKTYANILGGTRLAGFLYAGKTAFIPYYVTPESEGLYAEVERRTFSAQSLLCGKQPFVLYTGNGNTEDILRAVTAQRCKKEKSTTDSYMTAMEKLGCPVAVLPLNENGLRQLRILSVPDYRERLIKRLLGKDYLPPENTQSDGRHKGTNENYLIGFDCNLIRFEKAIQTGRTTHIFLLSNQVAAVQKYLLGRNAVLHSVEAALAEDILSIPHTLPEPDNTPFQTGKGDYLYAPSFRPAAKAGG